MTTKTFSIALPEDLDEAIKRIADENDRSRNAQIVRFLRQAVAQVQGPTTGTKKKSTTKTTRGRT